LGETLSVGFNIGNLQRDLTFGFSEPYAFDRPLQLGFTVYNRKYDFNQAKQTEILAGQQLNIPQSVLETLQNFSQSSTGFTMSASYPLHRSFKRVGLTYAFDNSSITTFSQASQQYFEFLAFRGISGPNALKGIVTSKITPMMSSSTIDNPMRPHTGTSYFMATDISGLGGSVRDIRPVVEYKRFIPMKGLKPTRAADAKNTLGFRLQGSFLTGYGGVVAPPFERFYLGGDTDIRGFDVRSITPYAYITNRVNVPLLNPSSGAAVPLDPNNLLRGVVTVALPIQQIVFTGGDTQIVSNVEYRIPIAGPVTLALFNDFGMNFVARTSQLRLNAGQLSELNNQPFGCTDLIPSAGCVPLGLNALGKFPAEMTPIPGTNYVPRMSTGVELQVIMPVVNAPFRIYWAYNPMRLNTFTQQQTPITRDMFPPGGAGDFSFAQARASNAPAFILREPTKTFRFTVSTTF
jgi:outer membrane protein insertion porin family